MKYQHNGRSCCGHCIRFCVQSFKQNAFNNIIVIIIITYVCVWKYENDKTSYLKDGSRAPFMLLVALVQLIGIHHKHSCCIFRPSSILKVGSNITCNCYFCFSTNFFYRFFVTSFYSDDHLLKIYFFINQYSIIIV